MDLDISFLFERPDLDQKAILTIEPLAPLSMVSSLPGSYYKSLDQPTKASLCGMLENIMGFHLGPKERKKIWRKMLQVHKKNFKIKESKQEISSVGYASLIGHLFEIEIPIVRPVRVCSYDDLWTQQLKHNDVRHLKGSFNIDYNLIKRKRALPKNDQGIVSDSTYSDFVKENHKNLPMYYTSPTPREFLAFEGSFIFNLKINSLLLDRLILSQEENNLCYLGTNEGWVDTSVTKL